MESTSIYRRKIITNAVLFTICAVWPRFPATHRRGTLLPHRSKVYIIFQYNTRPSHGCGFAFFGVALLCSLCVAGRAIYSFHPPHGDSVGRPSLSISRVAQR